MRSGAPVLERVVGRQQTYNLTHGDGRELRLRGELENMRGERSRRSRKLLEWRGEGEAMKEQK